MKLLIGKIICFLGICLIAVGASYTITHYVEKSFYYDINLLVTYEDTKTFKLENTNLLDKEGALKTYPYIMSIKNEGKGDVSYQLKINDIENSTTHSKLNFILYKNDSEFQSGNLADLKDDIIAIDSLERNKTNTYKLYIYLNDEVENLVYEYEIKVLK